MEESEHRSMGNLSFRVMAFFFKFRDLFSPPERVLEEAGVGIGFSVLDYGCGPGSHSIAAAKMVGDSGKVYALDIHPLAVEQVKSKASSKRLTNIEIIHSGCATGLPDNSTDVVLLYDTFHELSHPDDVLRELHRVLKPKGTMSFSDHHLEEDEIVSRVAGGGFFELSAKGKKTFTFRRRE